MFKIHDKKVIKRPAFNIDISFNGDILLTKDSLANGQRPEGESCQWATVVSTENKSE